MESLERACETGQTYVLRSVLLRGNRTTQAGDLWHVCLPFGGVDKHSRNLNIEITFFIMHLSI